MNIEDFSKINKELKEVTNELAYHVVGDPLTLSNLDKYLDVSSDNSLKVHITTAGNNISKKDFETLLHKTLKQVNFSINSYNANSHKKTLQEYLNPIFEYIKFAIKKEQNHFINLRIWNFDELSSAKEFNKSFFELLNDSFDMEIDCDDIYKQRQKSIKIAPKVFIHFDQYFKWPSLNNDFVSKNGFCYGLDSHFAILSSGDVAPCCLDNDAVINLGNVFKTSLKDILNSDFTKRVKNSLKQKGELEELCQKCEYRTKFDKNSPF